MEYSSRKKKKTPNYWAPSEKIKYIVVHQNGRLLTGVTHFHVLQITGRVKTHRCFTSFISKRICLQTVCETATAFRLYHLALARAPLLPYTACRMCRTASILKAQHTQMVFDRSSRSRHQKPNLIGRTSTEQWQHIQTEGACSGGQPRILIIGGACRCSQVRNVTAAANKWSYRRRWHACTLSPLWPLAVLAGRLAAAWIDGWVCMDRVTSPTLLSAVPTVPKPNKDVSFGQNLAQCICLLPHHVMRAWSVSLVVPSHVSVSSSIGED